MFKKGLMALLACGVVAGCDIPTTPNAISTDVPQAQSVNTLLLGQKVRHTLSGRRGQIISVDFNTVSVRFFNSSVVYMGDGKYSEPVITFETVSMYGFELEADKR